MYLGTRTRQIYKSIVKERCLALLLFYKRECCLALPFIFSSNLNTQPSLISIVSPLGNKTNEMWTPITRKIGEDVDSTYWGIPDLTEKA